MTEVSLPAEADNAAESRRYWRERRRRLANRADKIIGVPADTDPGSREQWTSPCRAEQPLCGALDRKARESLVKTNPDSTQPSTSRCCLDYLEATPGWVGAA